VPLAGGGVVGGAVVGGAVVGGAVVGGVVVGCWTGVVVTGPGFFVGVTEGALVVLPTVPSPRLGVVATMPAGTCTCEGLAVAGTVRLAEPAGAVAAGLTGELSLVVFIG